LQNEYSLNSLNSSLSLSLSHSLSLSLSAAGGGLPAQFIGQSRRSSHHSLHPRSCSQRRWYPVLNTFTFSFSFSFPFFNYVSTILFALEFVLNVLGALVAEQEKSKCVYRYLCIM